MNGSQDETRKTMPEPQEYTVPPAAAQASAHQPGPVAGATRAPSRWGSIDRKSPGLACLLSAMPGLGQIYVGYYRRGFVHAILVASIITLLNMDVWPMTPLLGIFLAFFWLYNIIDAGRRAVYYNHVVAGGETFDMPADFAMPGMHGSILGGLLLIAAGAILLSRTAWNISLAWMEDWWPVAPILFGVYLVVRAILDRQKAEKAQA